MLRSNKTGVALQSLKIFYFYILFFGTMTNFKKFGTFAGVFTPSLLTILGVIMYMRLGWVVGEAGFWQQD